MPTKIATLSEKIARKNKTHMHCVHCTNNLLGFEGIIKVRQVQTNQIIDLTDPDEFYPWGDSVDVVFETKRHLHFACAECGSAVTKDQENTIEEILDNA